MHSTGSSGHNPNSAHCSPLILTGSLRLAMGDAGTSTKQSSTQTKRLIYFRGHPSQPRSALITLICKQYETLSAVLSFRELECATRTLSNLYNLHAVRGNLNSRRELILDSAMSGPHHYFGYLNPYASHTIHIDPVSRLPNFYQHKDSDGDTSRDKDRFGIHLSGSKNYSSGIPVPAELVTTLLPEKDFVWLSGLALSQAQEKEKKKEREIKGANEKSWMSHFRLSRRDEEESVMVRGVAVQKSRTPARTTETDSGNTGDKGVGGKKQQQQKQHQVSDSLFAYPGVLALKHLQSNEEGERGEESALRLSLLESGSDYDLSSFGARLVPNHVPFCFDRRALDAHKHAQHKLRLITYNYGKRYVPDYLMKGNGVFIERHAFIQCITPLEEACGGFVILGREVKRQNTSCQDMTEHGGAVTGTLELIAVTIPVGQTLLVHPYSLHGDSFLTGMYSMGMTGNHEAMATADSVFLKHHSTGENVTVTATPAPSHSHMHPLPLTSPDRLDHEQERFIDISAPCCAKSQDSECERGIRSRSVGISDTRGNQIFQLLTSDHLSLSDLHTQDAHLRVGIAETIAGGEYASDDDIREHVTSLSNPLAFAHKLVARTRETLWHPVIFSLNGNGSGEDGEGQSQGLYGGIKTLGSSLPAVLPTP